MHLCADLVEDGKKRVRPYRLHKQREKRVFVFCLCDQRTSSIWGYDRLMILKAELN